MPRVKTRTGLSTEDSYIIVAGHRLRVRKLTHASGTRVNQRPVLVSLHEALGSIELWHDFPSVLSKATGCDALIYDRWGHGKSDPLTGRRNLRYVHDEALESLPGVLRESNLDDVILVGHSDGGSIALIFASEHQKVTRGVISEAAHVFVEETTLEGIREVESNYKATNLLDRLSRYHGDNTEKIFRAWWETWLSPEFERWNIEDCLPRIKCPILLIQGDDDQYGTKAQVEAIASQVSGPTESLLIPDCGHIPHRQARDIVVQKMKEFIFTLL